jgi:hypothetical protein
MDLLSTGSTITKAPIINAFVPASYKCIETTDNVEEEPLLEEENDIQPEIKQTSLDDFYQDFKL